MKWLFPRCCILLDVSVTLSACSALISVTCCPLSQSFSALCTQSTLAGLSGDPTFPSAPHVLLFCCIYDFLDFVLWSLLPLLCLLWLTVTLVWTLGFCSLDLSLPPSVLLLGSSFLYNWYKTSTIILWQVKLGFALSCIHTGSDSLMATNSWLVTFQALVAWFTTRSYINQWYSLLTRPLPDAGSYFAHSHLELCCLPTGYGFYWFNSFYISSRKW